MRRIFYKYLVLFGNLPVVRFLFFSIVLYVLGKIKNRFFLLNSKMVLNKFCDLMLEMDCEYWLEFGTLLGAIRENDFIKHDFDIDIGMFRDAYTNEIRNALEKKGFKRLHYITDRCNMDIYEETYIYKNVTIDIFFFYRNEKNKTIYCFDFVPEKGLSSKKTKEKYGGFLARKFVFNYSGLLKYNFLGINTYIPNDSVNHLKLCYGESFMKSNPSWSTYDCCNVELVADIVGVVVK